MDTPDLGVFRLSLFVGIPVPLLRANCENALFFINKYERSKMIVDYVLLTNMYDYTWRKNLIKFSKHQLNLFFYKPLFLDLNNIMNGGLLFLDMIPEDCLYKTGIIQARKQFIYALDYAVKRMNVKIVLLAASTKRLFGKLAEIRVNMDGLPDRNGFTLQEIHPDILLTNGDNGTAVIFNDEIERILSIANVGQGRNKVLINGLGFLGTDALKFILGKDINPEKICIISKHTKELSEIDNSNKINVYDSFMNIPLKEANNITAIINCTHNPESLITYDNLNHIQNGQSIHVIDVAVPYGFPEEEFCKCKNIFRQDGGNAYIAEGLEFYFNPEICGLTDKVVYGCFAETMCLAAFLKENSDNKEYLRKFDFFNVNAKTKEFVKGLFTKYGVGIAPKPYSFMKIVE